MTPQEARDLIAVSIHQVAPEADLDSLDGQADLREELELDSLDFLGFIETLSDRIGRRIEEDDYPELFTLDRGTAFLAEPARR